MIRLLLLLLLAGLPAGAQPVTVTAGEHPGFTRLVLQSARGFAWQVEEGGGRIAIAIPGRALRLDREQIFHRIPRSRVAAIRLDEGGYEVMLACPCPHRLWEDRAGVLVLDIRDPDPAAPAPPPPAPAAVTGTGARAAGRALARALAPAGPASAPADPAQDLAQDLALRQHLDRSFADLAAHLALAMAQGLVTPAMPAEARGGLLPAGSLDAPALPGNIRLRDAGAQAAPAPEDAPDPSGRCPAPEVLAFAAEPAGPPFAQALAALHAHLYGEFDQADAGGLRELAVLYLRWGFGAEARMVLDQTGTAEEVLVALADILEARQSNARLAAAGLIACPGPAALVAALAGAPAEALRPHAAQAAAAFQALPEGLRAALGPELVTRLLEAGAAEPARIVFDALARLGDPAAPPLARLAALLDQARGDSARAALRLDAAAPGQLEPLQLRLQIALDRGERVPAPALDDAVTLAAAERTAEPGRRVMELAILHHAAAGRLTEGFALYDRFAAWLDPTSGAAARLAALRGTLWQAAAGLPDPEFLELALTRADWRRPELDPATRAALAGRLRALGLESLAALLEPGAHPAAAAPDPAGAAETDGAAAGAADPEAAAGQAPADSAPLALASPSAVPVPAPAPVRVPEPLPGPDGGLAAGTAATRAAEIAPPVAAPLPAPVVPVAALPPTTVAEAPGSLPPEPAAGTAAETGGQGSPPPSDSLRAELILRGTAALADSERLRETLRDLALDAN